MALISENTIGVDLASVVTPNLAKKRHFRTGTQVLGDDGRRYQAVRASAAIAAGLATIGISLSGGVYSAAATGGTATNTTGQAIAAGDYFWAMLP